MDDRELKKSKCALQNFTFQKSRVSLEEFAATELSRVTHPSASLGMINKSHLCVFTVVFKDHGSLSTAVNDNLKNGKKNL